MADSSRNHESALRSSIFPRLHLFEWHELDFCPAIVRDGITEILRTLCRQMRVHEAIYPVLNDVIARTHATRIVDLCSGSGGPISTLYETGLMSLPALLTDKFPNPQAYALVTAATGGLIQGHPTSIDATDVPKGLIGVRTIFNAFHHFNSVQARAILKDAYASRQPIAIFEITERSAFNTSTNFVLSFLTMLAMLPKMRPFRWQWAVLTYLIPILPITFGWDGAVSCLRSYTEEEFRELIADLDDPAYQWQTGRIPVPGSPIKLNYFCGIPLK
ncbi:MAG: hypothetical protein JST93_16400 [Acidobacteria bacterium]|nr:hypothetical protein [Acidobacteriota bacterium]